ncbi:hypothetical protein [Lyngbya sp. CCY1209]|uniref:hypothetical protein n=1 Tax=Lyngbya sp. CCY1209 TaxID=2886103 RepID=UPI002D2031EF|nr:hypothetical protein [Lyngbya sp. CCY1209]MEB3883436.1 hypothetical protein [Lyngbya sp. CCY1209]
MPKPQETSAYQFQRFLNNIKNIHEQISQAIQGYPKIETWASLEKKTLNFDLLEDDLKKIHRILKKDGASILGTRLILDDKKNLIEIKIYSQKGAKNYVDTTRAEIDRLKNIPPDIMEEIKRKGRVELNLKFDD